MSGLDNLYDQKIKALASAEAPKALDHADASARADNPLCGDRATVSVTIAQGKVSDLSHQVRGCLICRAAANLAASNVPGLAIQDARNLATDLKTYLSGNGDAPPGGWETFEPLKAHPGRHTCALLPLQALREALDKGRF